MTADASTLPLVVSESKTTGKEESTADGGSGTGQALLAVKPQALEDVAQELRHLPPGPSRVIITILAGTTSAKVRAMLGETPEIARFCSPAELDGLFDIEKSIAHVDHIFRRAGLGEQSDMNRT